MPLYSIFAKNIVCKNLSSTYFSISREINISSYVYGMLLSQSVLNLPTYWLLIDYFSCYCDKLHSGPTQFLILSREDAVSGFRSLMGPTAPEHAKEVDPNRYLKYLIHICLILTIFQSGTFILSHLDTMYVC